MPFRLLRVQTSMPFLLGQRRADVEEGESDVGSNIVERAVGQKLGIRGTVLKSTHFGNCRDLGYWFREEVACCCRGGDERSERERGGCGLGVVL